MDLPAFFGALAGAVLGIVTILGGFIAWDTLTQRKNTTEVVAPQPKRLALDTILESHLEQYIVENFESLFPGWTIYDISRSLAPSTEMERRPTGIRYRTEAGEIDFLCIDSDNSFVVIELKRHKAPDKVVAQIDRYIEWVRRNLAQPHQQVRGLIIAKALDRRLPYILAERSYIDFWKYEWSMHLEKQSSLTKDVQSQLLTLPDDSEEMVTR